MKRIALTDGSGRWFDEESATSFGEAKFWNGSNHISVPTGSQWNHEMLYRTAGGRWILNAWSQASSTQETYEEISNRAAAAWLVQNEHDTHDACAEEYAALQIP